MRPIVGMTYYTLYTVVCDNEILRSVYFSWHIKLYSHPYTNLNAVLRTVLLNYKYKYLSLKGTIIASLCSPHPFGPQSV